MLHGVVFTSNAAESETVAKAAVAVEASSAAIAESVGVAAESVAR